MIITIDGPASSGKGTLAKKLAEKINYIYLDTGAMYRALTLYCLTNNIDINDEAKVVSALSQAEITFDENRDVYLGGANVTEAIRADEVSMITSSHVSRYEQVRMAIVEKEREIAQGNNIIVDGRDSGTVVFPDAELKLFISAALPTRAMRRYKQNLELGLPSDYDEVLAELARRDRNDILRPIGPLLIAPDAIVVDNTNMDATTALAHVYELVQKYL